MLRAAESGIALVTGTNAHGWGTWRRAGPPEPPGLARVVVRFVRCRDRDALRRGDRSAVERSRFGEDGGIRLALTAGDVVGTLTHLDRGRAAWLLWLWGPGAVGLLASRRARQRRMRRRRCPRAETCVAAPRLDCAHGSGAHTASIRRRSGRQPGGAARRRTRSRATAAARSCGRHDTATGFVRALAPLGGRLTLDVWRLR